MASDVWPGKSLRTSGDNTETYDVFISHRGPDTKTGFVGFLYDGLKRAGLRPFLDCISIKKGQDSWTWIEHVIKTTPIAIVIFSEGFSQSEWCLRELHVMLETCDIKVVPVFYKVEPCEVRFPEEGRLADGFVKLKRRHGATCIDQWRENLERASKLKGWEYKEGDERLEKDFVYEIVGEIFEWANKSLPFDVDQHVIGVDIVARKIIQRLDQVKGVLMLGLWGMGGIGKSTLARELYNCLKRRFEASSFIEEVTKKVIRGGIAKVQSRILKNLCSCDFEGIEDKSRGKVVLEERLCNKKILLVLDDVCENDEMEYLISRKMLSNVSMCIITSRDKRVFEKAVSFDVANEVHIHDVQGLDNVDSTRVFTSYAFGGGCIMKQELGDLVSCITKACGGVPLVLKVCGALLKDEDNLDIWKDVLKKLVCGSIMDEKKIFKCLRISYDTLEPDQMKMFLDIACVLLGQPKDLAIQVWRSKGWFAALGVRSLVEKALVAVDANGCFSMHDHLRDMGREIVKQEEARERVIRRSWEPESLKFLKRNETLPKLLETLVISGASNDMENVHNRLDFTCLEDLRIMRCWVNPMTTLSLPKNLIWFSWIENYDEQTTPSFLTTPSLLKSVRLFWIRKLFGHPTASFLQIPQSSELMILDLKGSHYETLCESIGNASKLEVLNLSSIKKLRWLPNSFGSLRTLRTLDLGGSGIEGLPESFGSLSSLENLDMSWCTNFRKLRDSFGGLGTLKTLWLKGSPIECLPKSFGSLSSLESLDVSRCENFRKLPDSFGGLGTLKTLGFSGSSIEDLPKSFGSLSSLENLNMSRCENFRKLPDSFGGLVTLKTLRLSDSRIEDLPESFGSLSSLENLNMSWCKNFRKLPDSFGGLGTLKTLWLWDSRIECLPESFGSLSSLENLNMSWCKNFRKLPDSFGGLGTLKTLWLSASRIECLPESFGSLSSLESLDMSRCENFRKLPDSFGGLGTLKTLWLLGSRIEDLPESFGSLSSLESLDMTGSENFRKLPDSFGGLGTLKTLRLSGSSIEDLSESFGSLSSLEELDMSWGKNFRKLPDSFGGLGTLKTLGFSGSSIEDLPKSFGSLSSLEKLNMSWCKNFRKLPDSFGGLGTLKTLRLSDSSIEDLPESFGSLSSLEKLDMSWCKNFRKLPDSFGGLGTLKTFRLKGSRIECLPESFGSLSSLESLDMSRCENFRKLPDSFGGLGTLKTLWLLGSRIEDLPESFGSLSSLESLDMFECETFRKLPNSFGAL